MGAEWYGHRRILSVLNAGVEVGGENGADKIPHNEVGKNFVAWADAVARLHQLEDGTFAKLCRCEQMLDDEREILGQAVSAVDEAIRRGPQERCNGRDGLPCSRSFVAGIITSFA